jgi:hypothetical protein
MLEDGIEKIIKLKENTKRKYCFHEQYFMRTKIVISSP